jgi:hypothetical protein
MTNQEISATKPFMLAFIVLLVYLFFMLYQYREVCKSMANILKGSVVALLVMLGIINDNK